MRYEDHDGGYGGSYHALESNGPGRWNFERGLLVTLLAFPVVALQFITVLMTVLGVALGCTGLLSEQEYGVFARPGVVLLAGVAGWTALRLVRQGMCVVFGGGGVPRQQLYQPDHR